MSPQEDSPRKYWDTYKILNLVLSLTLPVTFWLLTKVLEHENKITILESTTYTKENALDAERQNVRIHSEIERKQSLFQDRFSNIITQLDKLIDRLEKLEHK